MIPIEIQPSKDDNYKVIVNPPSSLKNNLISITGEGLLINEENMRFEMTKKQNEDDKIPCLLIYDDSKKSYVLKRVNVYEAVHYSVQDPTLTIQSAITLDEELDRILEDVDCDLNNDNIQLNEALDEIFGFEEDHESPELPANQNILGHSQLSNATHSNVPISLSAREENWKLTFHEADHMLPCPKFSDGILEESTNVGQHHMVQYYSVDTVQGKDNYEVQKRNFVPVDEDIKNKLLNHLGWIAFDCLKRDNSQECSEKNWKLEQLPKGYAFYIEIKEYSKDQGDLVIVGHPRSLHEFVPHLYWLYRDQSRNPDNCGCRYCYFHSIRQKEFSPIELFKIAVNLKNKAEKASRKPPTKPCHAQTHNTNKRALQQTLPASSVQNNLKPSPAKRRKSLRLQETAKVADSSSPKSPLKKLDPPLMAASAKFSNIPLITPPPISNHFYPHNIWNPRMPHLFSYAQPLKKTDTAKENALPISSYSNFDQLPGIQIDHSTFRSSLLRRLNEPQSTQYDKYRGHDIVPTSFGIPALIKATKGTSSKAEQELQNRVVSDLVSVPLTKKKNSSPEIQVFHHYGIMYAQIITNNTPLIKKLADNTWNLFFLWKFIGLNNNAIQQQLKAILLTRHYMTQPIASFDELGIWISQELATKLLKIALEHRQKPVLPRRDSDNSKTGSWPNHLQRKTVVHQRR